VQPAAAHIQGQTGDILRPRASADASARFDQQNGKGFARKAARCAYARRARADDDDIDFACHRAPPENINAF
jgi:hypothetical protein